MSWRLALLWSHVSISDLPKFLEIEIIVEFCETYFHRLLELLHCLDEGVGDVVANEVNWLCVHAYTYHDIIIIINQSILFAIKTNQFYHLLPSY
jgi:hypothetical protein